ncbi:MAG: hydrogenase maturation protease [Candidatus Roseilinea sp.]|uniref:hydrogenase maturation protease n=1 Tax=Candidatus Roseilinea sp. TaxID=2838777 RepID=UPI00404A476D
MKSALIIGYGNPDREDDGVGWRIVERLAARLPGAAIAQSILDPQPREDIPSLLVALQLVPEMAETVARYERVCFVDAHTGAYPNDLNIAETQAIFQSSPFTHHLTPDTLLALTRAAYDRAPEGMVISVRGYQFGFKQTLSPATDALANQAVDRILEWLRKIDD